MKAVVGKYLDDVIPKKVLVERSIKKSWKYGYNKEYDVIIISKDGTLGPIYEISGVKIGLPEVPLHDKHNILNYNLPKKDQKWKRQELPKGISKENEAKFADYIIEEYRRRREGLWIYINGQPEYLPGCFYFFLQWFSIGRMYPHFRMTQRDLMLFWEACYADPRCYGILYVKNRRLGWSTLQQSEVNNRTTIYREGLVGIISKTGTDAKSAFRKVVHGFRKLPFFFQPQTDGTTIPKTELAFTKPAKRITHKTQANYHEEDESLNTFVRWYNTDLNSMDSERIAPVQIIDEPGKFPKQVPFDEYWDVAKECLVEGIEIVGKAMVGSTINPPEQGGKEFKTVWDASDYNDRNANDQTKSGLYRIFIPAEYNFRGYFDEWGYPILDDPKVPIVNNEGNKVSIGAITHLTNIEKSLENDPEKLAGQKRKYPRTITDAFRSTNTECVFNAQKIYEQLDWVDHEMPQSTIQVGDLVWENGIPDTTVKFVPNPEGLFHITWQPPEGIRNNIKDGVGGRHPGNIHLGALGCDPYNRTKTSDGRGSQGSIHGCTKANMAGVPSDFYFLEYIGRREKVEYFFEDMIKAMVYWGMPAAIEQSNDEFLRLIKSRGYRPFMLTRPGVPFQDLTPAEKELGGFPAQAAKIANSQYYAIEAYVNDHVGKAHESSNREVGEMGKMYFSRTLNQWLKVDPDKRTEFDAYISSSLARIVTQGIVQQRKTEVKRNFVNPFATFDNSGAISKYAS